MKDGFDAVCIDKYCARACDFLLINSKVSADVRFWA